MSKVIVINHVTLDGVMQGPGRPEEDERDGFADGGWSAANVDDSMMEAVGTRLREGNRLLLGRHSYEGMLGYWNTQDSSFAAALNAAPKFVASTTLREPLPWPNTTLLGDDVPGAVADLKADAGTDLHVMGSGELIQTLLRHDLIDEYLLMIHPLVLGSGRRLFPDGGAKAELRLAGCTPTPAGVILATYRPAAHDS